MFKKYQLHGIILFIIMFNMMQHPPKPQPVHPAAVWQEIQKYLLPYHQVLSASLSSLPLN